MAEQQRPDVARASAWMALGTIVSRLTGFGRLLLVAATIGTALNADLFNNANTVPNALYILLAGGVFNVVLVPQLVRAMKAHDDGGDAFAQRIITLGLLVLGVGTLLLVASVPWLVHVVFDGQLFRPEFAAQRESARLLMWLCMPQVFLYGAFVLVGQVLNARGRFGPMMWAPIVNNLVACTVLGAYLVVHGATPGTGGFTTGQALLLGLGSTAGIAVQLGVLVPFLRRTGFTFRPRFDFRGVGLGHTLRLGAWTLGFILANQVAFIAIQRLGTRGTLDGARTGEQAAGSAVYEIGFLVSQMPHGVITVSLATAIIPTLSALAADRRHDRMLLELQRTMRIALTITVPLAAVVACLGPAAAGVLGYVPSLRSSTEVIGWTVSAFAPAMVAFTVHYLVLRGFYADEDTRTPFLVQLVVAAVNVAAAVVLTAVVEPSRVAQVLALSYGIAYVVGAALSGTLLSRRIGRLLDREMLVFTVRLAACTALAAATMVGVDLVVDALGADTDTPTGSLLVLLVAGAAGGLVYVGAARLLRLRELGYLVSSVLRRG